MCKYFAHSLATMAPGAPVRALAGVVFFCFALAVAGRTVGRRGKRLLGTCSLFGFGEDERLLAHGTEDLEIGHDSLL
jgi:hypothetical protein